MALIEISILDFCRAAPTKVDIRATIDLTLGSGFHLDVDLMIPASGITVLYGPSGSGKSTILRLLAGLEKGKSRDNIRISCGDRIWHESIPEQPIKNFVEPHERSVGYVFQQHQLFPHLNVSANLDFAIRRRRSDYTISMDQVLEWLKLGSLMHKNIKQLSGGEIQRVAIARVLLNCPRYILMDEPLGSIDNQGRRQILPYLESLHSELKIPIVYVTHSQEELTYLADQVYVLHEGKVKAEGNIFDLSSRLDLDLSEDDNSTAVLSCRVESIDSEYGLTTLVFDSQHLQVTDTHLLPDARIRVQIPARDVSISLTPDHKSSILNTIECHIESIKVEESARVLIRLSTGEQYLLARITRRSMDSLGLQSGKTVYAQIKSVALLTEYYDS